jgi:hypothetical protein
MHLDFRFRESKAGASNGLRERMRKDGTSGVERERECRRNNTLNPDLFFSFSSTFALGRKGKEASLYARCPWGTRFLMLDPRDLEMRASSGAAGAAE